jgi:glutathione peroxidase
MMRKILFAPLAVATLLGASSVHEFTLNSIDGRPAPLSAYQGKVLLLVNVASKCGYTPQYADLQSLYEQFKDRGLVVIGVPANNFGGQEPGTDQEIKTFCTRTYNVTFPMLSKVSVKGEDQTPLYQYLTSAAANPATAGDVKWNFTKFLVSKQGKVIGRFEPKVKPDAPEVVSAIEQALRQ